MPGGGSAGGKGWTVCTKLSTALRLAVRRAEKGLCGGQGKGSGDEDGGGGGGGGKGGGEASSGGGGGGGGGSCGSSDGDSKSSGCATTPTGDGIGRIGGGQTVQLDGLKARPDLNGEVGIALTFDTANGRWQVCH